MKDPVGWSRSLKQFVPFQEKKDISAYVSDCLLINLLV